MKEQTIQKKIMLAVSKIGTVIFRNNVGTGIVGKQKRTKDGNGIFVENPRPLRAGLCVGSSDLIGWTPVQIKGKKIAIFTAIEVKKPGQKPTPEQLTFMDNVKQAGGIAGVATSSESAAAIVRNFIATLSILLFCLVGTAQITFRGKIISDIPQTVHAKHGDQVGYCTPKNGKFVIKNIDEPLTITLMPSGKVIEIDGTNQPRQTIRKNIFLEK